MEPESLLTSQKSVSSVSSKIESVGSESSDRVKAVGSVCVCVYVTERKREGERERKGMKCINGSHTIKD